MKITRGQLRRIIKEERVKLNEQAGGRATGPLITLCQAWSAMGNSALQDAAADLITADNEGKFEEHMETVTYHVIDMMDKRLTPVLEAVNDPEAKGILDTIDKALGGASQERRNDGYSGRGRGGR